VLRSQVIHFNAVMITQSRIEMLPSKVDVAILYKCLNGLSNHKMVYILVP